MKERGESGEVMIEAVFVMIPTLFVMVFLISLGFLLYQQWNIQYVADDIANKVATTYSYTEVDIVTNEVTKDKLGERALYRYLSLFHGNEYQTEADTRGKTYGEKLLSKTSFANSVGKESISVAVEEDSLARRHVNVKVSGTYQIPFGEGLEIFGMESKRTFTATSVAECVDLSDYIGTVTYTENFFSQITGDSSKIIDMIDSWMKVFKHMGT